MIQEVTKTTEGYPRFSDGRINYTNERVCYVLNYVVISGDEVLLTKRGADVIAYPNTINGASGFIDDTSKTLGEMAGIELVEELDAPLDRLKSLRIGEPLTQIDDEINREWHVYPALAEFVTEFAPKANWENKSAEWFSIGNVPGMELMRGFLKTFQVAIKLRNTK